MVSSKIKNIESKVFQLIAEGHSLMSCKQKVIEDLNITPSSFDASIVDIMSTIRRTVISGPKQVFWQHIQRYDVEIVNHFKVDRISVPLPEDNSEELSDDYYNESKIKELEYKMLMNRVRTLFNLLKFLRQKEELLGFHKTGIKVIIKDSIYKKRELDYQLKNSEVEKKKEGLNISKLTYEQKLRLLELVNKTYTLHEDPGKIIRPIEAEIISKIEKNESLGRTENISLAEIYVSDQKEEIRGYYDVAESLRKSQLEAAIKAFGKK